jgi:hypothetical protein
VRHGADALTIYREKTMSEQELPLKPENKKVRRYALAFTAACLALLCAAGSAGLLAA